MDHIFPKNYYPVLLRIPLSNISTLPIFYVHYVCSRRVVFSVLCFLSLHSARQVLGGSGYQIIKASIHHRFYMHVSFISSIYNIFVSIFIILLTIVILILKIATFFLMLLSKTSSLLLCLLAYRYSLFTYVGLCGIFSAEELHMVCFVLSTKNYSATIQIPFFLDINVYQFLIFKIDLVVLLNQNRANIKFSITNHSISSLVIQPLDVICFSAFTFLRNLHYLYSSFNFLHI